MFVNYSNKLILIDETDCSMLYYMCTNTDIYTV